MPVKLYFSILITSVLIVDLGFGGTMRSAGHQEWSTPSQHTRIRRSAFPNLSWTKNEQFGIVFVYSSDFTSQEAGTITSAANELSKYSCIPVRAYSYQNFLRGGGNGQRLFRNYVFITRYWNSGCVSDIGMRGGRQKLNLDPAQGCALNIGVVMHEMIHSFGFDHEHTRPDRNQFVFVNFNNVAPGQEYNFKIKRNSRAVGPYDFNSIMHYPTTSWSRYPGQPTISSRISGYMVPTTSVQNLSKTDKEKLRYITGCNYNSRF